MANTVKFQGSLSEGGEVYRVLGVLNADEAGTAAAAGGAGAGAAAGAAAAMAEA